jgi:hypothetical protein
VKSLPARYLSLLLLPALAIAPGCSSDDGLDENGKPTLDGSGYQDEPGGKADGISGARGLPTSADNSSTAVWNVSRDWNERDPEAGMAWPANSGLTWDEKYQAWVDAMEPEDNTMRFITPYGKTLPAPSLECAEVAIFLRIAFASWYELPFFMEARDRGERIFFGHFGIRTSSGSWGQMPSFKTRYPDFSDQAEAVRNGAPWPSDSRLRDRKIPGGSGDSQPALDAEHAGAYFDEAFLNKRVGYYLTLQLSFMGSVNLADSANTWNLEPIATQPGDVLVKRHNFDGIGHTYVVKERKSAGEGQLQLENMSGSMPRRQPRWDNVTQSKSAFTNSHAGGEGFEEFGGGLKRWRTARNVNGRWTNVVLPQYADAFIPSTAHARISGRHETLNEILVDLSPQGRLNQLEEGLDDEREHLRNFPASCSARERREKLFVEMYAAGAELDMTKEDIDRAHRTLEDYIFAELVYDDSRPATTAATATKCSASTPRPTASRGLRGAKTKRAHSATWPLTPKQLTKVQSCAPSPTMCCGSTSARSMARTSSRVR